MAIRAPAARPPAMPVLSHYLWFDGQQSRCRFTLLRGVSAEQAAPPAVGADSRVVHALLRIGDATIMMVAWPGAWERGPSGGNARVSMALCEWLRRGLLGRSRVRLRSHAAGGYFPGRSLRKGEGPVRPRLASGHVEMGAGAGRSGTVEKKVAGDALNAGRKTWFVYMVRCADGTLYTGITKDIQRRLAEHNGDDRLGARYTRGRRPVQLCYLEGADSRSEAARREAGIKRLSRPQKDRLLADTAAKFDGVSPIPFE